MHQPGNVYIYDSRTRIRPKSNRANSEALYGLKSSGATWQAILVEAIHSMGFQASLTDPNVWY